METLYSQVAAIRSLLQVSTGILFLFPLREELILTLRSLKKTGSIRTVCCPNSRIFKN